MDNHNSNVVELNPRKDQLNRYLSFLPHDKENVSLLFDTLSLALSLGELESAAELVKTYEEIPEKDPQLNAIFGHIYLYLLEYDKAVEALNFAIDSGVKQSNTFLDLAQCYHYLHQPAKSKEVLLAHPELGEEFPVIYYPLLARALYACDESTEAIQQLKIFHESNPETAESAGLLALLLFEEDEEPEKALELASSAIEANEKSLEGLLARSMLLFDKRDFEKALLDANNAIEYYPNSGRAWSTLSQLEFNNFRYKEANDAAKKACEFMQDHIGTWHILGWSHLMLEELDAAQTAFEKSYDLDKRFFETHGGLAAVFAHKGETKKANNHIKIAEKLQPNGFAATYAKMVLLNKNNEHDKAKALFESAKTVVDKRLNTTPQALIEKRLAELFPGDQK